MRRAAPLVQGRSKLDQFPDYTRFFFEGRPAVPLDGARSVLEQAEQALAAVEPFEAGPIERGSVTGRTPEVKPREAFQPIRIAVTGSKVSPGLFESLELLGRDDQTSRDSPWRSGLGGASGSSARWNSNQERRRKLAVGRGFSCHSRSRASVCFQPLISHFKERPTWA